MMKANPSGLISRKAWGASESDGFEDRPLPISEWWLHHSVTIAPDLLPPFEDDDAAIRTLERIGEARFGGGVSYTVPITPVGRAYVGHSFWRRGAHTRGHNTVAAAICLVGDYERNEVTPQMIEEAARVMVRARREGLALTHTFDGPHSAVFATACPGRYGVAAIPKIDARAVALWAGNYAVQPTRVVKVVSRAVRVVKRQAIAVDGDMGPATIRQWQKVMKSEVDGVISKPSTLVRKVQRFLNAVHGLRLTVDGYLGAQTWRAIQRHLRVVADGVPGPVTIKALQRRLNEGRF